jgi:hypothetical protein
MIVVFSVSGRGGVCQGVVSSMIIIMINKCHSEMNRVL